MPIYLVLSAKEKITKINFFKNDDFLILLFNSQFEIISRQEKIFDATFSKLIAENYNAKPLSPVSYYGKCLK